MRFAHKPKGSRQHQERLAPVQTLENRSNSDTCEASPQKEMRAVVKKIMFAILLLTCGLA
jgi:hypothetical protein